MLHLVLCPDYLAGIFDRREDLEHYLVEIPERARDRFTVREVPDVSLPCFLVEDSEGIRAVSSDELETVIRGWLRRALPEHGLAGNVYWVVQPWRPRRAGTDMMGLIPHEHVGAQLLDVFERGGLRAFLDATFGPEAGA